PPHLHTSPTRRSSDLPRPAVGRIPDPPARRVRCPVGRHVTWHPDVAVARRVAPVARTVEVAAASDVGRNVLRAARRLILVAAAIDRKSTRLNSSHVSI